jgi:adenylate cyclase
MVDENSPSNQLIKTQLLRILSSPEFRATARLKKFLKYIVEKTLDGQVHEIKGYFVATRVFGRKDNFKQSTDPVVSVEARRLRRALEHYYLAAGIQDPVLISVPLGTFVPTFQNQIPNTVNSATPSTEFKNDYALISEEWPTVLIHPFENLSNSSDNIFIAEGFVEELAVELSRHQAIRVVIKPKGREGEVVAEPDSRFAIEGSIRLGGHILKVAIHLYDKRTSSHLWGEIFQCNLDSDDVFAFQEKVARIITATIAEQDGVIVRILSQESRRTSPSEMKTYEAIHRFYKFETTYSTEAFSEARQALTVASRNDPGCAQVWAYLGGLYVENYGLEMVDIETPLETGIRYIEKAIQLDPSNQIFRIWMAEARLFNNQLPEGLVEVHKALSLNAHSLVYLDTIGYALALLGEWEQGCGLIKKAIKLNPYIRAYNYYILCWNWIRKKEYEKAYTETLNFRLPEIFWDPLNRAITLGLLGRVEEAKKNVIELLKLKPNFNARGRILIRNLIKSDELVEQFIESLEKADLYLD